jgi:hypothetical protein
MLRLSYFVQCSPTAVVTQKPNITPTSIVPSGPIGGGTGGATPPIQQSNPGSGDSSLLRIVLTVMVSIMGLLLSLGIGWLVFRRMLMPQNQAKLPPSGAVPWSRTRIANPHSHGGIVNAGAGQNQANMSKTVAFSPNGNGPTGLVSIRPPANNGPQNPNIYGPLPNGSVRPANSFNGMTDGFIPPSPQIFPQGDPIPPGSGVFKLGSNNSGYSPSSNAFAAMYGLPEDPAAPPQANASAWMDKFGNGNNGPGPGPNNGNNYSGPPPGRYV